MTTTAIYHFSHLYWRNFLEYLYNEFYRKEYGVEANILTAFYHFLASISPDSFATAILSTGKEEKALIEILILIYNTNVKDAAIPEYPDQFLKSVRSAAHPYASGKQH